MALRASCSAEVTLLIGRGGLDVGGAGRASLAGGEGNKGGLEDVEGCCENGRD